MSSDGKQRSTCQSCGSEFGCGAKVDGCWCTDVKLTDWQAEIVRSKFDDCLCPTCLGAFAVKRAMRVVFHDGRVEMIEDAIRVDTQNFHEGMYDFYDAGGNLLRQIDMGSGISWKTL
ncbi:MAG: cysteine-rich CWC family protein [Pyrinomonadaceae bacterium]